MKLGLKKDGEKKPKKARRKASGESPVVKLRAILVQHAEKIVLGIIALASVWLIYSGMRQEKLQTDPEQIRVAVQSAKEHIESSRWDDVKSQRAPAADQFDQQASQDTVPISPDNFVLHAPFHPILTNPPKRRPIPQLLAPRDLEVKAGYGPLAIKDTEGRGSLAETFSSQLGPDGEPLTRPLPDKFRQRLPGESSFSSAKVESRYFVSITGLVPFKEQVEQFEQAFKDAQEYQPERDQPRYLTLRVQRREVQPDGTTGQWVDLDALRVMRLEPNKWEGRLDERAAADHVAAPLVMPLPPLLFRDVTQYALHSQIPQEQTEGEGFIREETGEGANVDEDLQLDLFRGASRERGEPMEQRGSESGESSYESHERQFKADLGLLRYFDFEVEPGKRYQYRVKLVLEDPNNPAEEAPPSITSLSTEAAIRRQQNPDVHFVETPWSDPSPPVTVPSGRTVLAGSVDQPRPFLVGSTRKIEIPRPGSEPSASIMAVVWDKDRVMDVPAKLKVQRGALVNAKVDTEAIDPSASNVRKLPAYPLKTGSLVLDIAGGESLGRSTKLKAPGQLLVLNQNGTIEYHDEMEDQPKYEQMDIPPEEDLTVRQRESEEGEEVRGRGRRGRRGRDEEPSGDEPVEERGRRRPR